MLFWYCKWQYLGIANDFDTAMDFFDDQISEHQRKIDFESENSSCYVECYLKEMNKFGDQPDFGGFE